MNCVESHQPHAQPSARRQNQACATTQTMYEQFRVEEAQRSLLSPVGVDCRARLGSNEDGDGKRSYHNRLWVQATEAPNLGYFVVSVRFRYPHPFEVLVCQRLTSGRTVDSCLQTLQIDNPVREELGLALLRQTPALGLVPRENAIPPTDGLDVSRRNRARALVRTITRNQSPQHAPPPSPVGHGLASHEGTLSVCRFSTSPPRPPA